MNKYEKLENAIIELFSTVKQPMNTSEIICKINAWELTDRDPKIITIGVLNRLVAKGYLAKTHNLENQTVNFISNM